MAIRYLNLESCLLHSRALRTTVGEVSPRTVITLRCGCVAIARELLVGGKYRCVQMVNPSAECQFHSDAILFRELALDFLTEVNVEYLPE
jgi:hypothetical protein